MHTQILLPLVFAHKFAPPPLKPQLVSVTTLRLAQLSLVVVLSITGNNNNLINKPSLMPEIIICNCHKVWKNIESSYDDPLWSSAFKFCPLSILCTEHACHRGYSVGAPPPLETKLVEVSHMGIMGALSLVNRLVDRVTNDDAPFIIPMWLTWTKFLFRVSLLWLAHRIPPMTSAYTHSIKVVPFEWYCPLVGLMIKRGIERCPLVVTNVK